MQDSQSERKHPMVAGNVGGDDTAAVKGEPGVATSSQQHHGWQDGRRASHRTVPVQRVWVCWLVLYPVMDT